MDEVEVLFREVLGEKHPFTWQVRGNRAVQIRLQGRLEEAEAIEREVVAKIEELNGRDQEAIDARCGSPRRRRPRGHPAEALPVHRDSLAAVVEMGRRAQHLAVDAAVPGRLGSARVGPPGGSRGGAEALGPGDRVLEKQAPPPQRLAEVRTCADPRAER